MNALKEMLALAERPTVILKNKIGETLSIGEIITKGNQLMSAVQDNSFGVEKQSIDDMQNKMKSFLANLYPRLSMEPLKWRDENGYPLLAIFSINHPLCKMGSIYKRDCWSGYSPNENHFGKKMEPDLFNGFHELANCYSDVFQKLIKKACQKYQEGVNISCRFSGLIPQRVRMKIKEVAIVFPDTSIFIIAEPENWSEMIEPTIIKADPLIVLWWDNSLRLIADFDTTSVEEAMIFEAPDKKD